MPLRRSVLVYHNELLPYSATFIRTQAAAVKAFNMGFVGLFPSRQTSLDLRLNFGPILFSRDHTITSRIARNLFVRTGWGGKKFLRELEASNPALIHAHFALDASIALEVATQLGIPLITSLHGYDVTIHDEILSRSLEGRIYLKRRERLWERCAHFFCSCDYIRGRAIERGFPAAKLETLYSGHNLTNFDLPPVDRNRNLIVYVGRLVEKKGCSYLIRAAHLASKQCPDLQVAIIGDGPLRPELEALVKDLGVRCTFLGTLSTPGPGNSVLDWLNKARVFCMPSVTGSDGNTEGQPAVFVEAHALGVPAVSFNTAGIGEAVLNGETGLLVPEKDIAKLADALTELLTNDILWDSFSARARTWVAERFDIRALNIQLENAYRRVLQQ
ncbi:MAG: glycosyltransferase [Terracidiphilus sp.]|jgi:glycosyltransferase involved in cell wall biosynthesis